MLTIVLHSFLFLVYIEYIYKHTHFLFRSFKFIQVLIRSDLKEDDYLMNQLKRLNLNRNAKTEICCAHFPTMNHRSVYINRDFHHELRNLFLQR